MKKRRNTKDVLNFFDKRAFLHRIRAVFVLFRFGMIPWILIPTGILIIIKSDKISQFTGEIPLAEKIFGTGGTYIFIKVMGLLISIFSFMYLVGGLDPFFHATIGKFIPGSGGVLPPK